MKTTWENEAAAIALCWLVVAVALLAGAVIASAAMPGYRRYAQDRGLIRPPSWQEIGQRIRRG